MIKQLDKIRELEDDIDHLKGQFLRARGWLESCKNPRSLWYWEKDIDGKHFTL